MVKLDNVTEGVLDVIMIINSVRPVPLTCVKWHINLPRRQRAHQDKEKDGQAGH